jgi:hypothetical protein
MMLPPLNILIEKEARQKCGDRLKSTRTDGHSLSYDEMMKESPIIAAKTDISTHSSETLFRRSLPQIECAFHGFQVTTRLQVMRWLTSWLERGSAAIFCGLEPALPLTGSISQLMTKKWAENADRQIYG